MHHTVRIRVERSGLITYARIKEIRAGTGFKILEIIEVCIVIKYLMSIAPSGQTIYECNQKVTTKFFTTIYVDLYIEKKLPISTIASPTLVIVSLIY